MEPTPVAPEDDDAAATGLDPTLIAPRRLRDLAAETPDRPFLTEVDGSTATYAQMHDRVRRWCQLLRSRGLGPGDRIVSLVPGSIDAVCVWFAASLIGALEVPVNPELRGEFLRHVVVDAGPRLCVARPEQVGLLHDLDLGLDVLEVDRRRSVVAEVPPAETVTYPDPTDSSCVIYTSGTTGPAKGVVVTWAQTTGFIGRIPRSWFSATEVTYAPWPMFHVTGRTPIVIMLDRGGRVVLRERFSLSDFWSDIVRYGVSHAAIAPVIRLLADAPGPARGEHPLRLVFGGRDPGANVLFASRFGVRICTSYGSTEIGFPIVNRFYDEHNAHLAGWPRRGYQVKVVDASGATVPPGTVGELLIRPPRRELMFREYLGRPDVTERAIAGGWYHTGDAVRIGDDGGIVFVDRMGDTIRRFGENISSVAVENVVARLPGVADCAVVGVPSDVAGQEVMLVVVASRPSVDEPALFAALQDELPKHALPAYIALVDELPKTANAKTRKGDLAALVTRAWRSPVLRSTPA